MNTTGHTKNSTLQQAGNGKSRSTVWVIVWLFLFFPVGLYLLWTNSKWCTKTKIGITAALVLFSGLIIVTNQDSSPTTPPSQITQNNPKAAFLSSCETNGTNKDYCTCAYDHITANYTMAQLAQIGLESAIVKQLDANARNACKHYAVKTKVTPTPTTDPCQQYMGSDMYVTCENTQDAREKGQALNYPLKAKVTYDSSAVYITNTETQEWDGCAAIVNETDAEGDNFMSDSFTVNPGQTVSVGWGNFANAEQVRYNYFQTKPATITLDCIIGGTTDPKTGASSGGQEHRSIFTL